MNQQVKVGYDEEDGVYYFQDEILQLLQDDIFSRTSHNALARLVPHIESRTYSAGEAIYSTGDPADYLYIVSAGEAQLISNQGKRIDIGLNGRMGEESATDFKRYISSAIAHTDLTVMRIQRNKLAMLFSDTPELKSEFYLSLLNRFSDETFACETQKSEEKQKKKTLAMEVVGWSSIVLLSPLIIWLCIQAGLNNNAALFSGVFTATILMWVFKLVDEYVPGIFALLTFLCIDIAPPQVILSGFVSDGFFMAMSILGLGTVIVASGLSYRILLWLLLKMPATQFGLNTGLWLLGCLITPILPTANGRVAMLNPFLKDMIETLKMQPRGKAATMLAISCFSGTTLFSGMFMTSKSINFAVYGMMSPQTQEQFQWVSWLTASLVTGLVLLFIYSCALFLFYRNTEPVELNKDKVRSQLELLGNLKTREWAAVISVFLFLAGILTTSIHKIQPAWIGLAILYFLLLFGFLLRKEFKEKIDWPFLIYLASIIGIISTMNSVGLDKVLSKNLALAGTYMRLDFAFFILILAVLTFVIRLVAPINASIVILAAIFVPFAEASGINQWVVGFIILFMGENWILPYQCSYYMQFSEVNKPKELYDERSFLKFNFFLNFAKLVAIYASLPYWKALGLL
ncbi:MAG: cyclic nucleotide-binding domain-containing protein [Desulfobulbaceae bacterium]|nr:cyclic nucleotide-binding domain-containing protein [Desulfobulbaceae bacterium]